MRYVTLAGLGILGLIAWTSSHADASPLGATVPNLEAAPSYTQVARRVVRRTTVHRGPARTTVRTTTWRRPTHYRWRPGGAIAAGAAIGFVGAAAAAAWAGAPPAPGYCWYYRDASRTRGFWDVCP
jgi:hypothetical protein